jgi:hypothetical protein
LRLKNFWRPQRWSDVKGEKLLETTAMDRLRSFWRPQRWSDVEVEKRMTSISRPQFRRVNYRKLAHDTVKM